MDQKAILDHEFLVAAYAITWAIQLGYVAWLGLRWRAQKRESARSERNAR
jgi:CcmD family protein